MLAVDSNILIYAHREDSVFYERADAWLSGVCEGQDRWAIPWPCINEFLGHVTNPRIYRTPTPIARAFEQIETWMASPTLTLLAENESYWQELCDIVTRGQITGPRVHDARIAALVRAHGVAQLATCDRDFSRFAGIAVFNPLVDDQANEGPRGRRRRRRRRRTAPVR